MYISPKLTAQVTLPKAAFSPSERYFQADLGEGAAGYLLPGGGREGGGRWGLFGAGGGGERDETCSLRSRMEEKKPKACSLNELPL